MSNTVLRGSVRAELACSQRKWWSPRLPVSYSPSCHFSPGVNEAKSCVGSSGNSGVFCGVRTTAPGWARGQTGPLIFRRLLWSAHRGWLFLQLQFLLILFSWWIAEWNVSLLWAERPWCIEDASPSAATRQAAFWLNDPLCIIWW